MVMDANLLFRFLDNNSLKDLRIRNATTLATKKILILKPFKMSDLLMHNRNYTYWIK